MSSFVPINVAEDSSLSKKELEEEHTREIQVEQAFSTFQRALAYQKQGLLLQANKLYEELFTLTVVGNHYFEEEGYLKGIQNGSMEHNVDGLNLLSQNVKLLRYLIFRNRGFLHLELLRNGPETVAQLLAEEPENDVKPTEKSKELFYTMLEDLTAALIYQEGDEEVLELLYELYVYLGLMRLVRFTLEYRLSGVEESDDVLAFLPVDLVTVKRYHHLLAHLHQKRQENPDLKAYALEQSKINAKYAFLDGIKTEFINQQHSIYKKQNVQIKLPTSKNITWLLVVEAVDTLAKHSQDKKKIQDIARQKLRYADPYLLSETPQDNVEIEIPPLGDVDMDPAEPSPPEQEPVRNEDHESVELSPELGAEANSNDTKSVDSKETRIIQRASKRLARNDSNDTDQVEYVVTSKDFVESERFFLVFNQFLHSLDETNTSLQLGNIVDCYFAEDEDSNPLYIRDFLDLIDDWKLSYSQYIAENEQVAAGQDGTTENKKLLEILASYGNKDLEKEITDEHKLDVFTTYELIRDSINYHNTRNVRDVKSSLLRTFFAYQVLNDKLVCLIADFQFNAKLLEIVKEWTIQLEPYIAEEFYRKLDSGLDAQDLSMVVSIFEILTDAYYSIRNKMADLLSARKSANKGSKGHVHILAIQAIKLKARLDTWTKAFDDIMSSIKYKSSNEVMMQKCRYLWADACLEKLNTNNWKSTDFLTKKLLTLVQFVQENNSKWSIPNYNYENIPSLNLENINSMISTVMVLSIFAKILYADSGNSESISVLESILMDGELSERQSLKDFLETSSIDLKLNLWSILFDHYERSNELSNLQTGYECYIRFLFGYLQSQEYRELAIKSRSLTLLIICNSFSESTSKFLESLERSKLCLPIVNSQTTAESFPILLRFFELFYLFSLHEEAAILSPRKCSVLSVSKMSYTRLKSYCAQLIAIILIYYKNIVSHSSEKDDIKEAKVCEFMRMIHEQFGARRLCDSDHGRLLKYIQHILTSISCTPEKDLIQIMNCRYHYNITYGDFSPDNHETTEVKELDASTAEELAHFILPVYFKENPLVKPPRQDLKLLIEDLHSILGNPDLESNEVLKRNKAVFDYFLDSEKLSPRFFRETYYGLYSLKFEPVTLQKSLVMSGLYYLQALLIYASYKIRKKSMQTRSVELETIVRLLEFDLIYNSNRLESWLILGQVYGFLVEDDLIWTSDKLTYPERKVGTANLQRKSIICYLMAINASVSIPKDKKKYYKKAIGILLASFAKELYSACMEPMNGHAFEVLANPKFIKNASGTSFTVASKNMVSMNVCLKLMERSLQMSLAINEEDWTTYYYYAKILRKMKRDPKDVLDVLVQAGNLAKEQSTSADHIIEPHYSLCCATYKYVKADKLLIEDGLQYLRTSPIIAYEEEIDMPLSKPAFYKIIIECLNRINNYDKKKWHHKPRYRLAYIYYHEFGNVEEALKEMGLFVSVKATNKTLVLIWKPENERPGKHFCYTYEYAMFYIDLLVKERNLNSLIQMLPKLRRSNSTMIKLYNAWERLCGAVCGLIRELLQIDETFTEKFLSRLSYKKFIVNSKLLIDSLKSDGLPEELRPHICFLNAVNDMKKFNNGFGPTALIDDTVVGLYICFYNYFLREDKLADEVTGITESPSHRPKKMAKRDVFPLTIEMLKILKRDIDQIMKDEPDTFNDFIKLKLGSIEKNSNGNTYLENDEANQAQNGHDLVLAIVDVKNSISGSSSEPVEDTEIQSSVEANNDGNEMATNNATEKNGTVDEETNTETTPATASTESEQITTSTMEVDEEVKQTGGDANAPSTVPAIQVNGTPESPGSSPEEGGITEEFSTPSAKIDMSEYYSHIAKDAPSGELLVVETRESVEPESPTPEVRNTLKSDGEDVAETELLATTEDSQPEDNAPEEQVLLQSIESTPAAESDTEEPEHVSEPEVETKQEAQEGEEQLEDDVAETEELLKEETENAGDRIEEEEPIEISDSDPENGENNDVESNIETKVEQEGPEGEVKNQEEVELELESKEVQDPAEEEEESKLDEEPEETKTKEESDLEDQPEVKNTRSGRTKKRDVEEPVVLRRSKRQRTKRM